MGPAFESLGVLDDVAADMNLPLEDADRDSPAGRFRDAWRAFRARHPKLDKMFENIHSTVMGIHGVLTSRLFQRIKCLDRRGFDKILRLFYKEIGGDFSDDPQGKATFYTNVSGWTNKFLGQYRAIVAGLDEETKHAILAEALSERTPLGEGPVRDAVAALQALFREVYNYAREAGLPIADAGASTSRRPHGEGSTV